MPNYTSIKIQILQAGKIWRKLASSLHSKLSKFKRSKSLKKLKTTLGSKRSRSIHARKMHQHVYVDDLYKHPVLPPTRAELTKTPCFEQKKEKPLKNIENYKGFRKEDCSSSKGAVWEMGEVDLRAEMFIRKFKEDMKLQRQRSFEEYHEMLARSV